MKRALPLWLAAVVPAALAGHGLTYALMGRSSADGHHAWVAAALEYSLVLLLSICSTMLGSTLLRAGVLIHTSAERSWLSLWPRLALLQLALFAGMERAEGTHAGLLGCAIQILTALVAAYLLYLFGQLLVRCGMTGETLSHYHKRALPAIFSFVSRRREPIAHVLAVRAGTARFQRPPPPAPIFI